MPAGKIVSFLEEVQIKDIPYEGGASVASEKHSQDKELNAAILVRMIKQIEILIADFDLKVLDILVEIEKLNKENRWAEHSSLPESDKRTISYGNRLMISKKYCDIEALKAEKLWHEHRLVLKREEYLNYLKA
jgi:hypothetical protein